MVLYTTALKPQRFTQAIWLTVGNTMLGIGPGEGLPSSVTEGPRNPIFQIFGLFLCLIIYFGFSFFDFSSLSLSS